jgi:UDP-N-acetylmuramoyl-tripeptide--D-alanyl-D-alanine ligase
MLELGDEHEAGHRAVGEAAAALGVDVVVVVTDAARGIAEGASGGSAEVIVTAGREEAANWVRQNAGSEDVVLVKASRGAALEFVAEQILEETTL